MKIDAVVEMIHKNGNLVDQSNGLPIKQRKSAIKELILNNNSVIALNNNNLADEERHSVDSEEDDNNNDHSARNNDFRQYKCPVCKSEQFTAGDLLDQHLRTHHPTYRPSCRDCGELFPTLKSLARHSIMHVTDNNALRHNPLNSKILDFLENKKFLLQQLSESIETSQSYRCNFCGEHFTGTHFMSHWKQCKQFPSEATSNAKLIGEGEEVKSSFFAGLNLHSRQDSHNSSDTESYGSTKSEHNEDEPKVPNHLINAIQNAPPSYPAQQFESEEEKKLTKDENDFLNRVRDMKRRGEFPCRLCTKVFRNLRALKGHARVHIAGIRNSRPYQCNICLFSTTDKSVIIRHIRNHNGDHPYKCQLCLSTFTTKANCERHLRNAHRKTSREDIKRLLVDLNNKQQNTPTGAVTVSTPTNTINKLETLLTSGQIKDTKDRYRSIVGSFSSSHHDSSENDDRSRTSLQLCDRSEHHSDAESSISNDSNNNTNSNVTSEKKLDSYHFIPMLNAKYSDFRIAGLLDIGASKADTELYKNNLMMRTGLMLQDNGFINVSPLAPFCDPEPVETEEPLDLSVDIHDSDKIHEDVDAENMDTTDAAAVLTADTSDAEALVLDLRKKKDTDVEDLTVRSRSCGHTPPTTSHDSIPQSPQLFLRNSTPYAFPSAPMMPNLSQFFVPTGGLNAAFPGVPKIDTISSVGANETHPSKLRPLIYEHLVANAKDRFEELRQSVPAFDEFTKAATMGPASDRDNRAIVAAAKDVLAAKVRNNSKSSTVKMVMKDGVLVEKQKQRRYRTEKPFSCAYCPGRFTLRSNMDRHVKQQHPSHWRQRQRGGSSRAQRTKLKDDMSDTVSVKSEPQTQQLEANSMEGECEMSFEKRSTECSDADADDDMDTETVKRFKKEESMENSGIGDEDDEDGEDLVIDEEVKDAEMMDNGTEVTSPLAASTDKEATTKEENPDLASVRSLLDNVSTQTFSQYFGNEEDRSSKHDDGSEEDEEGLVAGSSSEGNGSGGEDNRAPIDANAKTDDKNENGVKKKKSAYSSAPNRVHCDFCSRSFPWASSLRRHTLTHTGQKPYKCSNCPLLFTTKSNCDRHFLRKHRSQLTDIQQQQQPTTTIANSTSTSTAVAPPGAISISSNATAIPIDGTVATSNNRLIPNFSTRNVPERPFKCSHCPSSTFSTYQNLKKHIIEKHNQIDTKELDEGSHHDLMKLPKEDSVLTLSEGSDQSNKSVSEEKEVKGVAVAVVTSASPVASTDQNFCGHVSSDLPFKCHLCDRSFGERQEALDHISEAHPTEFQQLICKGALDMNVKLEDAGSSHEEAMYSNANSDENNMEPNRGRFPDYSCRKVICAFCLRRFWSAEDLRRHMRTHTGERPFSCDICQRRFTLKHSMLRHRKKHSNKSFASASGDASPNTDDEEPSSPYSDHRGDIRPLAIAVNDRVADLSTSGSSFVSAPRSSSSSANHSLEYESSPDAKIDPLRNVFPAAAVVSTNAVSVAAAIAATVTAVAATPTISAGLNPKVGLKSAKEDGVDLIAKLLDIDDKELVDEMLTSKSADDVAKMLGVQK